ncbi:hypothetical protein D8I35_07965 [Corticibacter populi]|uniref:DoxX family membrane protein n=2 Tax=Corticibacter populi TaxID=1550736 RepID=A0A3M6QTV4_9BURK|nr:hypothetical protein D8I35_07965 [Corticibacter populi]
MALLAALAWCADRLYAALTRGSGPRGRRLDLRDAMRWGAGLAFLLTGTDHFLHDQTRYLPMIPEFFSAAALPLVWLTGAAEMAGAIGLLLPLRWNRALGWPAMRQTAGACLGVLLCFLVIANIHVAVQGSSVQGLPFGIWYFWLRPLFQPLIIAWVLFAAGILLPRQPGP